MAWSDLDLSAVERPLISAGIKTANYTANSNEHIILDTITVGSFTVTLPSNPSLGDIVKLSLVTEHVTRSVSLSSTKNINGGANTAKYTLMLTGDCVEFMYIGGTCGWFVNYDGIRPHMACIARSASQSLTIGQWNKVAFDTELSDVGYISDYTTDDRINIRRTGNYFIHTRCTVVTDANSNNYAVNYPGIYKNGTLVYQTPYHFIPSYTYGIVCYPNQYIIFSLVAADYLELKIWPTLNTTTLYDSGYGSGYDYESTKFDIEEIR